jgi:hypothetical protein
MAIKIGSPAVLLTEALFTESGPALPGGSRVTVVALDPSGIATVRSRDGDMVTRVPASDLRVTRGRPARVPGA